MIDLLQLTGEYEKEERESLMLLKDAEKVGSLMGMIVANQSLGNAYVITYQYEKALAAFEKAYTLLDKVDDSGLKLDVIHALNGAAQKVKDYPRWLEYIQEEEEHIAKSIRESNVNFRNIECLLYDVHSLSGLLYDCRRYGQCSTLLSTR